MYIRFRGYGRVMRNRRDGRFVAKFGSMWGVLMAEEKVFTAIIHQEDDLFVAECPEVGSVRQGETVEKALQNLKEATELYLEEFSPVYAGRPILTVFEAVVG